MRGLLIAAALFAGACTPPAPGVPQAPALEDAAGNRFEALAPQGEAMCSAGSAWCVEIVDNVVEVGRDGETTASIPLEGGAAYALWPSMVLSRDVTLIGVSRTDNQMYSGGGGSASELTLYDISGPTPRPVLTAPLAGSISIRACFDDGDVEERRGACHDEYDFTGSLALDPTVQSGPPRLVLTTEATTYPGRRSRATDSSQQPPLQQEDLQRVRDEACSVQRVASLRDGAYVWDSPLPACPDFLEP